MGESHNESLRSKIGWYALGCAMLGVHYVACGVDSVSKASAKSLRKLRRLRLSKQQQAELRQIEKLSGLR
jgi:hypothetical protein